MKNKVVLITGATSGFGNAISGILADSGYIVYGSFRTTAGKQPLVRYIEMDITKPEEVQAGVNSILEKEGKIDILIQNAGIGIAGPVEEANADEISLQMDTNFSGAVHAIQSVLPSMRMRKEGIIFIIGSIGGKVGLPFQGFYSASKFALEGLSEALRIEVSTYNIKIIMINPGDFNTSFTRNRKLQAVSLDGNYSEQFRKSLNIIEKDENSGEDPIILAKKIKRILTKKSPAQRYVIASPIQKLAMYLANYLPGKIYRILIADHYKVKQSAR
ncbi:MAG: SDR family NAD(P)-dependent oxidoreductase [Bacteroidales bacterium]|nr:SDR family NAD(P)-dependent oxidoreductase [Bacteroidales bacterium]